MSPSPERRRRARTCRLSDETGARVMSLETPPYDRSPAGALLAQARRLVSPVPLLTRSYFEAMGRLVKDAIDAGEPDVLHLVSMYSCWYRDERLPAVIDLLDVVSGLCLSAAAAHPARYALARLQARATERVERRELGRMAAVIAINGEDATRVRRLGVEPTIVPLAVHVPSAVEIGLPSAAPPSPAQVAGGRAHAVRGQLPAPSQPRRGRVSERRARAAPSWDRDRVHAHHRRPRRDPAGPIR